MKRDKTQEHQKERPKLVFPWAAADGYFNGDMFEDWLNSKLDPDDPYFKLQRMIKARETAIYSQSVDEAVRILLSRRRTCWGKDPINQRSTKITGVRVMESINKSSDNQRTSELRALKDLVRAATLFLVVVAALVLLSMTIEQNTKDSEARCKSLGGVTGQTKCFKNGKEI